MEVTKENIIWIFVLGIDSFALLANVVGVFVIFIAEFKSHQSIVLFSLTVAEMIGVITGMIDVVTQEIDAIPINTELLSGIDVLAGIELLLMMVILTIDRLIYFVRPEKYSQIMSVMKTKVIIVLSWLISIIIAILYVKLALLAWLLVS